MFGKEQGEKNKLHFSVLISVIVPNVFLSLIWELFISCSGTRSAQHVQASKLERGIVFI